VWKGCQSWTFEESSCQFSVVSFHSFLGFAYLFKAGPKDGSAFDSKQTFTRPGLTHPLPFRLKFQILFQTPQVNLNVPSRLVTHLLGSHGSHCPYHHAYSSLHLQGQVEGMIRERSGIKGVGCKMQNEEELHFHH
jgi:hypothetical protein